MNYCMSGKKKTVSLIIIGLLVILMGRMFYGSFKAGIIILPLVIPIYRQYSTKYKDRAKAEFEHQYKEMLVALKDGIVTGYSVLSRLKFDPKIQFSSDKNEKIHLFFQNIRINHCRSRK